MKITRECLGALIVSGFTALMLLGGLGIVNSTVNSSPETILIALVIGVIAIWSPKYTTQDNEGELVGLWRRFFAFYLDFIVIIALSLSIAVPIVITLEYISTGIWRWSYEREAFQFRDVVSALLICVMMYFMAYYFYKHAADGKATPGQYIMGYRIVPVPERTPDYAARTFYGAIALWLSIFTLISAKPKNRMYWWDKKSNTRAVAITT